MNRFYVYYCLSVVIGCLGGIVYVFISTTFAANYTIELTTNLVGEHWFECIIILSSLPGIMKIVYDAIPSMNEKEVSA